MHSIWVWIKHGFWVTWEIQFKPNSRIRIAFYDIKGGIDSYNWWHLSIANPLIIYSTPKNSVSGFPLTIIYCEIICLLNVKSAVIWAESRKGWSVGFGHCHVALPFSPFCTLHILTSHVSHLVKTHRGIIRQQGNTMHQPDQAQYRVTPSTWDPARKGRSTQTNKICASAWQQLTRHTPTQLFILP